MCVCVCVCVCLAVLAPQAMRERIGDSSSFTMMKGEEGKMTAFERYGVKTSENTNMHNRHLDLPL